ncbi:pilus assembly PilX family protein [Solimonas fluminis]|uniref:pilus assembly PilX family protein n=1 Tax=Solimonas fluminis TaxID=2086571 RepID=UPI0013FDA584|nr:PilX N-terminal domain-containing pilus assembly protein [Solimonas fluminis]
MTSTRHIRYHPGFHGRRSRSGGVVLVLALVLLVVMTVSSVVAMRGATASDMVSQNIRSQNLALQAAEIALRYCERQLMNNATLNVFSLNNGAVLDEWRVAGNWTDTTRVNTTPSSFLGSTVTYATPPQCIVRRLSYDEMYGSINMDQTTIRPEDRGVPPGNVFIYRITARGFSPEFQRNSSGKSISGSEAWVQSTIRTIL